MAVQFIRTYFKGRHQKPSWLVLLYLLFSAPLYAAHPVCTSESPFGETRLAAEIVLPFSDKITLLNTSGSQRIDLSYQGNPQNFKIIISYTAANKTQSVLNILLNKQRIDSWKASSEFGTNTGAGKSIVECIISLKKGDVLTINGTNTKLQQKGTDYIKIIKTNEKPSINQAPVASFQVDIQGNTAVFNAKDAKDPDGNLVAYQWNFGDGKQGNGMKVSHTYATPGSYKVTLKVTDDLGADNTFIRTISIAPPVNQNPVARFTYTIRDSLLLKVGFNASASHDPDGSIRSYLWEFGNGKTGAGVSPVYTYASEGTYFVKLKVTDQQGASSVFEQKIVVVKSMPVVSRIEKIWLVDAESNTHIRLLQEGSIINLAQLTHRDINFEAVAYGAGTSEIRFQIQGDNFAHTATDNEAPFAALGDEQGDFKSWQPLTGTYTLTVTPYSKSGPGQIAQWHFTVVDDIQQENIPPVAILKVNQSSGEAPIELIFDASSTTDPDGFVTSYLWDFGNGRTASGEEIRHTYTTPGIYTVTLTVLDNENATHSTTRQITITPPQSQSVTARFLASEYNSIKGQSIFFDASGSKGTQGYPIISYDWDLGDGTLLQGQNIYHDYRTEGTYYPRLTVTNGLEQTDTFSLKIVVRASNQLPVAYVGDDQTLHLPKNEISLTGAGSDEDGNIISYKWMFLSGPAPVQIDHPANPVLPLRELEAGVYVFRFTVVDNNGAAAYDDVKLTVVQNEPERKLPVVYAGEDITTQVNHATIKASVRETDSKIVAYQWKQVLGQPTAFFDAGSLTLDVTELPEGESLFRITVTDDQGNKAHDDVRIIYQKKQHLVQAKKAFTPNGDGIDDTWHIENTEDLQDCQLVIIDRTGNKVFEVSSYQNEWDATINGRPLPNADYYYVIKCQDGSTEAGGVRVIR